jgi:Tfp pilus assembly protein PilF
MYTIDERIRGLPAARDQIIRAHQSLNQPNIAIPGRQAGRCQAWVVGLRGPTGCVVFVYLYMPDAVQCAVYVPSDGPVAEKDFPEAEAEALAFVESMGFMMDDLNFRAKNTEEQRHIMRTLPVFQKSPTELASRTPAPDASNGFKAVNQLGKLFGAFCLAASVVSCAHVPNEKERDEAQMHYELGLQNLVKAPQAAMKEIEESLTLNPTFAEAWHAKALLLHHSFRKFEAARAAYQKALELKTPFSEVRTNLGNLYMDEKRYADAIKEYNAATEDVLYGAQFMAHGNMGWAYYKLGETKLGVDHLKSALTLNPKYCLGYFQLGQVYEDLGEPASACKQFSRFKEHCPERPEAHHREGLCQAKNGQIDLAMKSFDTCIEKTTDDELKDLCAKAKETAKP